MPSHTPLRRRRVAVRLISGLLISGLALAALLAALPAAAIDAPRPDGKEAGGGRNLDARLALTNGLDVAPAKAQVAAVAELRRALPDLSVTYDQTTGAVRTLSNRVGFLTPPDRQTAPLDVALGWVRSHLDLLGLSEADLAEYEVTDSVFSKVTGATHVYLRQLDRGVPVYNGQLQVNVNRDGRILSINNAFVPGLAAAAGDLTPALSAASAVAAAATHLSVALAEPPRELAAPSGARLTTRVAAPGLSLEQPLTAGLMLLPVRRGEVRLVWSFPVYTTDRDHIYDFNVDAISGEVWTRFDWVADATYKVYPIPIESPNHTSPVPPADGRVVLTDPFDVVASPFGWHDTNGAAGAELTILRGNNAHAYQDSDGNDTPPAVEPDCGASLTCEFPIDFSLAPSGYQPAATANLFYWNNILHDVHYQYGFDEAGGNFQVNNYGRGGIGSDYVQAQAQSAGNCNANFGTPPDGSRPRMRMFVCTNVSPAHDGDLDAGVIAHEFGHGVSNRLVGGPSNVSCLDNNQQPGEGLSDWWGLVLTARVGDLGTDGRGVGTYLLGQPITGPGVRTQKYSTDPTINTWTYSTINGAAIPHGVGSRWAQAAWEVYWALVDAHGFDPDIYDALGGAGNQRAMLYVAEGLKNTVCSPAFTDVRDGILQAAVDNYGGEDVCTIWEAFAGFGLGTDAVSGGPNSTTPTDGFQIPIQCQCTVPAVPAGVGATAISDAQTDLSWSAAAGADTYTVHRAAGTCASAPAFTPLAPGVAATAYSDNGAAGTTYSYEVTAVDTTGNCESAPSACVEVAGFTLAAAPPSQAICAPADGAATITVGQVLGSVAQVTLGATGNPAGTTALFSVNPVTPAGASLLTISGTGSATAGHYVVSVTGTSASHLRSTSATIDLFTAAPGAPSLSSPADGALDVLLSPTLSWSAASQAGSYTVEVATDPAFSGIVFSAVTGSTSQAVSPSLTAGTLYYWRVRATNACATGANSATRSFTTVNLNILLVDDDDNGPNVQTSYTEVLDGLGAPYTVWDVLSHPGEPTAVDLAPYTMVIWFSGDRFTGSGSPSAGPQAAAEAALGTFLNTGRCLFISSQDYLYDMGGSNHNVPTSFMTNYLGLASGTSDVTQTTVTGTGTVFAGLGPYSLSYPFSNFSDRLSPTASAEVAFTGNAGSPAQAAVDKDGGTFRTAFFGFPFEAVPVASRPALMQKAIDFCTALGDDLIYKDSFASGSLAAWSSATTDGGDLAASAAADLDGSGFGLAATLNDTNSLYVQDDSPTDENRYRARFRVDPNGYTPGSADGQRTKIFQAFEDQGASVRRLVTVVLRRLAGQYKLLVKVHQDDDSWVNTGFFDLTDAPHVVELDWQRSTAAGANDGSLGLWIDGSPVSTLPGLDNDLSQVDFARLGTVAVKPGASGTLYLDGFESRRLHYIGTGP